MKTQESRLALIKKANSIEITDLVEDIVNAVEGMVADQFDAVLEKDSLYELVLDRVADAIESDARKALRDIPCDINGFEF